MFRYAIPLLLVVALPAAAFDIEKWADDMVKREQAGWRNERLGQIQKDKDPKARAEAARGMSTSDPEELMALGNALSDPDARVRWAAASRLWDAGERAAPMRAQLTKALDDSDANVVAYAAGALQAAGVKEAELAPARKRVLDAPEASVTARFYLARNLVGYESPKKLLPPMLAYLERQTERAIGGTWDENSKNIELGRQALEHLVKKTKDRSIIQPMWEALIETRNAQVPLMRVLGLYEPRPEGWTRTLLRQTESPNPKVRSEALSQMRSVKQEKEVAVWAPRAAQLLDDPDASVRSDALWALGSAAGLAASEVEKVAAATGDADKSVRRSAVRALGEMAEPRQAIPAVSKARINAAARPAIERALKDDDSDVRDEAKSAMRNLGEAGTATASAGSLTPVSAPASASAANEAAGMAVLRKREAPFDESMYFRALQEQDVELVRAYLDAGMSPTKPLFGLGSPMRAMFFSGQSCSPRVRPTKPATKEIVKILLERGADVNATDAHGNSAFIEAASKGCDREVMRMLLKAGGKIDAKNGSNLTAFEMGLYSGHDGLEELIAAGYRLSPDKARQYLESYKDTPAAVAMVKKASAKK
jgi:HEAT repeat protein